MNMTNVYTDRIRDFKGEIEIHTFRRDRALQSAEAVALELDALRGELYYRDNPLPKFDGEVEPKPQDNLETLISVREDRHAIYIRRANDLTAKVEAIKEQLKETEEVLSRLGA